MNRCFVLGGALLALSAVCGAEPVACYHVIDRGNNRVDIFKTDGATQAPVGEVGS